MFCSQHPDNLVSCLMIMMTMVLRMTLTMLVVKMKWVS